MVITKGWTYWEDYVPQRKGSYFAIEKDGMKVDATVIGWLDENLQPTTKKKAGYIVGAGLSALLGATNNQIAIGLKIIRVPESLPAAVMCGKENRKDLNKEE